MRKLVAIALAGTLAGAANGAGAQPAAPASPAVDAIDAEASRPDASLPTAVDQHEDEGDLRITQHIRQALIDADDVSWQAKNVTVVTQDGTVTLRGPVATADEKQRVGALAQSTAGVVRVRNELEVKRAR